MVTFDLMHRFKTGSAPLRGTESPAHHHAERVVEALLFAAKEPLDHETLANAISENVKLETVLESLQAHYAGRGIQLVRTAGRWSFRTADDLGYFLRKDVQETKKLSKVAQETLAIIAYHQPVTRADIEAIRGVSVARGTLEILLETGWVRLRGRRKTPGRPVTFGTTPAFLDHFGLNALSDLPGLEELKSAGLLDGRVPTAVNVPMPSDDPTLRDDEEPIEGEDVALFMPLDAAE